MIEVYPSLLCDERYKNVDLYIKLKLGIFSFIWYYSPSTEMVFN